MAPLVSLSRGAAPAPREGLFADDDLRPLSTLQHLIFCERQCALIQHRQGAFNFAGCGR